MLKMWALCGRSERGAGGGGQGELASGEDVRDAARTVSDIASYGGT